MEILKRFQRYTLSKPQIILNPNTPPQPLKMVEDPEGEYILIDQLKGAIEVGGLIVNTPELQEHLADGDAQKGLLRDLTKLGYEDFDQVMKVLKDARDSVITEKEFEIWSEGYQATGENAKAALHGKVVARSFHEAVEKYIANAPKGTKQYWHYSESSDTWLMYGCKVYDNEAEAREYNG